MRIEGNDLHEKEIDVRLDEQENSRKCEILEIEIVLMMAVLRIGIDDDSDGSDCNSSKNINGDN